MTLRKFNLRSLKVENVTAGSNVVFGTANVSSSVSNTTIGFVTGWPSDYHPPPPPPHYQGSVAGYSSGDLTTDKFPFTSDTDGSLVGNLSVQRIFVTGQSSSTHGYTSGGSEGATYYNIIDNFPFSSDTNSPDVGDLSTVRRGGAGSSSESNGYNTGGNTGTPDSPTGTTVIDKFPFSANSPATNIASLVNSVRIAAGQNSSTHGYSSGGFPSPSLYIQKYSFASDGNATSVGNLTAARYNMTGQSSDTHGYTAGGSSPTNRIDKFPFASDTNAATVGSLVGTRFAHAGHSSTTFGYVSSGQTPSYSTEIEKFPFSSDTNSALVGDVANIHESGVGGTQV